MRDSTMETRIMKTAFAALAVAALALASTTSADAKGCIKGAIVGGVAGHYAGHHGVLGAAAGCAFGHSLAKGQEGKRAEEEKAGDHPPKHAGAPGWARRASRRQGPGVRRLAGKAVSSPRPKRRQRRAYRSPRRRVRSPAR